MTRDLTRADDRTVLPATTPPPRGERLTRAVHVRLRAGHATMRRWEQRAPRLIALARALFYPCAIAVVAYMGYEAARDTDLAHLHYWALGLAFAAALVWWLCLGLGWASLVGEGDPRPAIASWCRTQVARYLPGSIWVVVARATTVKGRLRDKLTAVAAENVIVLLVSLAVGGAWASIHDWRWLPLTLLIAAPLLASRWLQGRTRITGRQVRRTASAYTIGYVAYGAANVLVQIAVSGVRNPTYPLYVAGASCLAWAVGLVVVFAPGGVGVREVVYVWLLSGLYPTDELRAAAITSRLVTVAAELAVLAATYRTARRRPAPGAPAHLTRTSPSDESLLPRRGGSSTVSGGTTKG